MAQLPRSATRLLLDALALYRSYSLLFLALAAGVVVPYEAIVLALTGAGPFAQGALGFWASNLLLLADLALISPLVSAMHVHAVREVREGGNPRFGSVARQGLRVLPGVAIVSVVYGVGTTLGLVALIAPGIYLMLRWAVAAQSAAIEQEGWRQALRRSGELADDHYGHVFLVIFISGVIVVVPSFLIGLAFGHGSTDVASFLVGTAIRVVSYSFGALVVALLYYDLRLRWELAPDPAALGTGAPDGVASLPIRHALTRPKRMRY